MNRFLIGSLLGLAACGPSDSPNSGPDGSPAADAGTAEVDATTARCTATANYGLATLSTQTASGEGSSAERYNLEARGELNADAAPDAVSVLLYGNEGSFGEVLSTGVFSLDGIESSFATCGACVLLDTDTSPGMVTEVYMPASGQLEILEVGARFRAVLTNARFRHVLIDVNDYTTTDVEDGCGASIERAEFDVAILN